MFVARSTMNRPLVRASLVDSDYLSWADFRSGIERLYPDTQSQSKDKDKSKSKSKDKAAPKQKSMIGAVQESKSKTKAADVKCYTCSAMGHIASKCPEAMPCSKGMSYCLNCKRQVEKDGPKHHRAADCPHPRVPWPKDGPGFRTVGSSSK
jgi:hypothetical protein